MCTVVDCDCVINNIESYFYYYFYILVIEEDGSVALLQAFLKEKTASDEPVIKICSVCNNYIL